MIFILIFVVGSLPVSLSFFMFGLYGNSRLSRAFFYSMCTITFWQWDDTSLYAATSLHYGTVLFLVRFFRLGQFMSIPLFVNLVRVILSSDGSLSKSFSARLGRVVFSRRSFIAYLVVSLILYGINWTPFDIASLSLDRTPYDFFFKVHYGPLDILYLFYLSTFSFVLLFSFIASRSIISRDIKFFVVTINGSYLTLFLVGMVSFLPHQQYIQNSLVTLVTSAFIAFSFMKMYNKALFEHSRLLARKSKLEFTGNMTNSLVHEFKNLLTSVKGSADVLASGINSEALVNNIVQGSKQMQRLVDSYQKFMREGDMNPTLELANVNSLVSSAIEFVIPFTDSLGVTVYFEGNQNIEAFVNESMLMQVVVNLVKNGAEAIPANAKVKLVKVLLSEFNDSFIIDVIDSGSGVEQSKWQSIFQDFTTTKATGSGLGLPFSFKTVVAHRGKIGVVASDSSGTHIRVTVPKNKVDHLISIGG